MITRNDSTKRKKTKENVRTKSLGTSILVVICVAMLGGGFFFAARQHFSSMDYGMKNSRLRKQIDQLEAEKRRLILAREISLSPVEVKKAAKKAGLMDPPAQGAPMIASADPMDVRAASAKDVPVKNLVHKTVAVAAAPVAVTTALKKPEKTDRASKKQTAAE